ncbi:MAG TPA: hypothetical protein DIW44_08890 [Anaerolineaceae bacterium]|nr:hypothetical protein [Anaerolineaceae bacterium]
MGKRIWLLFIIIVLTLSTGCELNLIGTSQATQSGPSLDDLSTLSALATQTYNASPLDNSDLSTSTPVLELPGQGGELPTATLTPKPTKTTIPGTIKITSITQKSPGVAVVKWEATGNFPSGFKIVFSDQVNQPTYPENTYASIYNANARAGVINYVADRIYYVRVCRFINNTCDVYSDLGIFAYAPPTKTPKPTRTPAVVIVDGVEITYDPSLVITKMKTAGSGKAYIEWTDSSSSGKGYRIVYSHTSPTPTLGTDPYFSISDPKARSAFVDGDDGNGYYYRICRFNGSTCTSYSKPYIFNFPGSTSSDVITITSVIELSEGVARIGWTAEGSFPNGFKIMYSKTTKTPTLSDSVTTVSDGAARSGNISGTVNSTYYVQVCKVSSSGGCSAYSQIVYFTFSPDYAYLEISGIADNPSVTGSIDLDWYAYGNFPDGYLVLLSTNPTPSISNSTVFTVANEYTDTATAVGSPNTTYYLSVCKAVGSSCGYTSDPVKFTTASTGFLLTNAGDPQVYDWSITASNPGGYHIFWVKNNYLTPEWSIALTQQAIADPDARTVTLGSTLTAGHYLLRLCTWDVDANTCTTYSNTLEIDVN